MSSTTHTIASSGETFTYRCEVVTPAGRQRYLEILYRYLKSQKSDFSVWQLWQNTTNPYDIAYMNQLAAENDWITIIKPTWPVNGNNSICKFFEYTKREDTIYIRLDDDIVYLSPNFIKELYEKRLAMRAYLFIYPNIINNAIISHIHSRNGLINSTKHAGYACLDNIGWQDPVFCENVHTSFLNDLENNAISKWSSSFNTWICNEFERVSINCICWFGSIMKHKIGIVGFEEEQFLSVDVCKQLNTYNVITNSPVCAHFAFYTQRKYIETQTDILQRYDNISKTV